MHKSFIFRLLIFKQHGWAIKPTNAAIAGWLLHYTKNTMYSPCTCLHKREPKDRTKTFAKFPEHFSFDYGVISRNFITSSPACFGTSSCSDPLARNFLLSVYSFRVICFFFKWSLVCFDILVYIYFIGLCRIIFNLGCQEHFRARENGEMGRRKNAGSEKSSSTEGTM